MKNSKVFYHELIDRVTIKDSPGEISEIVCGILSRTYGLSRSEIFTGRDITRSPITDRLIDSYLERINKEEPLQYVLNEAYFYGRKFYVDESVLIPRPETEELVRLAVTECQKIKSSGISLLDIGTGSGCIAITLSLEVAKAVVYATDVSEAALAVAKRNQKSHQTKVSFVLHDILHQPISFPGLNLIVSNPPYIAMAERRAMAASVHHYEPGLALFVPDNEPLMFYEAICAKAVNALIPGGTLMVEVNERFSHEVASVFNAKGFGRITVLKDTFNKNRMVMGHLNL